MVQVEKVIVVGAGIIGLTTARELQDAGYDVEIWSADPLHSTCSAVAAAFWYPYVIQPEEAVLDWGIATLERFKDMKDDSDAGVTIRKINAIFKKETPDPVWAAQIPSFRRMTQDEIPESHTDGFTFDSVAIEMSVFLPHIINEFKEHGGQLIERKVEDLQEVCLHADVVVNCTGLGAKELCNDDQLKPVRGQVACTEKGELEEMYSDCDNMMYIVPFENVCILGGTAIPDSWDKEPSEQTCQDIIERCSQTLPAVKDWNVIEHRVGLRPSRDCVRLEVEERADGTTLIHNYGHGGAGVTLSYGCAAEVVELVERLCINRSMRAASPLSVGYS